MSKCSFCYTKTKSGDLKGSFENKTLLTLLCQQLKLPLDVNNLESPFEGFPSCPECQKLHKYLDELFIICNQIKDQMRVTFDDIRTRIELSQPQLEQINMTKETATTNAQRLRAAIVNKYVTERPKPCSSKSLLPGKKSEKKERCIYIEDSEQSSVSSSESEADSNAENLNNFKDTLHFQGQSPEAQRSSKELRSANVFQSNSEDANSACGPSSSNSFEILSSDNPHEDIISPPSSPLSPNVEDSDTDSVLFVEHQHYKNLFKTNTAKKSNNIKLNSAKDSKNADRPSKLDTRLKVTKTPNPVPNRSNEMPGYPKITLVSLSKICSEEAKDNVVDHSDIISTNDESPSTSGNDNQKKRKFDSADQDKEYKDYPYRLPKDMNAKIQDYKCDHCWKIIPSTTVLCFLYHLFKHQRDSKTVNIKCHLCQKGYVSRYLLQRHIDSHDEDKTKPLACDCDERFEENDQEGLEKHKKESPLHKLDAVNDENCRVCSKTVSPRARLREHEYTCHPELRIHECHICGKAFVVDLFLETHLTTHTNGPYNCQYCIFTCNNMRDISTSSEFLEKHLCLHTGEKIELTKKPALKTADSKAPNNQKPSTFIKKHTLYPVITLKTPEIPKTPEVPKAPEIRMAPMVLNAPEIRMAPMVLNAQEIRMPPVVLNAPEIPMPTVVLKPQEIRMAPVTPKAVPKMFQVDKTYHVIPRLSMKQFIATVAASAPYCKESRNINIRVNNTPTPSSTVNDSSDKNASSPTEVPQHSDDVEVVYDSKRLGVDVIYISRIPGVQFQSKLINVSIKSHLATRPNMDWTTLLRSTEKLLKRPFNSGGGYKCEFCSEFCMHKEESFYVQHLIQHEMKATKKPHKCYFCEKTYASNFLLQRHIRFHILYSDRDLACELCDIRFMQDDQRGFFEHINRSVFHRLSWEESNDCRVCHKTYSKKPRLRRHECQEHPELNVHKCNICEDKSYVLAIFLETHMTTHRPKGPFPCSCCYFSGFSAANLEQHLKSHTGFNGIRMKNEKYYGMLQNVRQYVSVNKHYKCEVCSNCIQPATIQLVIRHLLSHERETDDDDPQKKPFSCSICPKRFVSNFLFERHIQFHAKYDNGFPLACELCDKRFKKDDQEGLKKHMEGTTMYHKEVQLGTITKTSGIKIKMKKPKKQYKASYHNILTGHKNSVALSGNNHACNKCKRSFHSMNGLNLHKRRCRGVSKCDICNKTFGHQQILQSHINFVHGQKCICDQCGRTVASEYKLKLHMKKAHHDKSTWEFVCYFCNKRFCDFYTLKLHFPAHTKEKVYKCETCKKTFMYQSGLQQHYATITYAKCKKSMPKKRTPECDPSSSTASTSQPETIEIGLVEQEVVETLVNLSESS